MASRRRKAQYVATLIYIDEPQLILLQAGTTKLLAVAIPCDTENAKFLAVTVNQNNWERYSAGNCDLRFLFSFPHGKILYYLDLMEMKNKTVTMTPAEGEIPEDHLPYPRIFSTDHTTDWEEIKRANYIESLDIDGQWEMNEFGSFYQKYANVYAFISAVKRWGDASTPQAVKGGIKSEFTGKPFQGGSSYVHFFDGLFERIPVSERPGLREVEYASPGFVKLRGESSTFRDMEQVIRNFLGNRSEIAGAYGRLHSYLSRQRLLTLAGRNYPSNDPTAKFIAEQSRELSKLLAVVDFDDIWELTNKNALVAAKVVLATYRRVEDSSRFFAEGRITFS